MGDEPFNKQQTTSSRSYARSTSPHHLAYATERAKILFGCYRRVDANDPDTYVAAIARVLSVYDAELIREATDPLTGIVTSEKYMSFMPSVGELKVYCDGVAARRDRLQRLGSLPPVDFSRARLPPPPPQPGDKATIFVPASNPRYPELLEWSKTADPLKFKFEQRPGIWVSYDTWDSRHLTARRIVRADTPQRLELSEEAKRVMGMVDAERNGTLPADEAAE
jgi:hypothetical protein